MIFNSLKLVVILNKCNFNEINLTMDKFISLLGGDIVKTFTGAVTFIMIGFFIYVVRIILNPPVNVVHKVSENQGSETQRGNIIENMNSSHRLILALVVFLSTVFLIAYTLDLMGRGNNEGTQNKSKPKNATDTTGIDDTFVN